MTSLEIKEQIETFLQQNLDSESHFLVKVSIGSGKVKEGRVQVLMDSDSGITIDECALYSRKLGKFLDEADLFENAYTLEVASPGLDYPLSTERQFRKNINRKLIVETKEGKTLEGKLLDFAKDQIHLETEEKKKGKKAQLVPVAIPVQNILKAKVTVSFK
jgi:ribosome maturation factor RimP